ncbi:MAG: helix-turn-helix transcriptional regulator [Hyphomicrobiales bacterium]
MMPKRFKELRLKNDLTQERLAFIAGVSVRNIQQFEQLNGVSSRKPNPMVSKLLEYIDEGRLDIDGLLSPKEEKREVLIDMKRQMTDNTAKKQPSHATKIHLLIQVIYR